MKFEKYRAVYCYEDIYPHYWTEYPVGKVNGSVFNQYMTDFLEPFNKTWPYYEMFNVKHRHNNTNYLNSRECFDFVMDSLVSLFYIYCKEKN